MRFGSRRRGIRSRKPKSRASWRVPMHSEVRLQHRYKPPHQEEQREQEQKSDSGLIFVVFLVLRKGKRTSAAEREPDGREPRKKQRHGLGILVERGAVMLAKLCFFSAHDHRIKQHKIA